MIEKDAALDDRGKSLSNVADARVAAREWGPSLRSQSARDTMHLIISAKAGTDVAAFTDAARAFLHDRFADHKFMFGVHTDKESAGHIHAHAVITVKNESGQKIRPNRDTFAEWREVYAQHAQAQGLKIVATTAKERASSQSYGPKDKAIVEAADRPRPAREARDRAYAADPANQRLIDNARQRIRVARTNPIRLPMSAPDRKVVNESIVAWKAVTVEQPSNRMAKDMLERLLMAQTVGAILHTIDRRDASLGAGFVRVAARRAGDADAAEHCAAGFDHHAAADQHHIGKLAQALHRRRLGCGDKIGGVALEADRGPRLAGCRGRRVRTGEAIAQHHLGRAGAIDHRDRHLIAALAAIIERGLCCIQRDFGVERLGGDGGVLRARRSRGEGADSRHRQQSVCLHPVISAWLAAGLLVDRRFRIEQQRDQILDLLLAQHLVRTEARHA